MNRIFMKQKGFSSKVKIIWVITIDDTHFNSIFELIDKTCFIVSEKRKEVMKAAVYYFFQEDFYECCILILPQLEHSLR